MICLYKGKKICYNGLGFRPEKGAAPAADAKMEGISLNMKKFRVAGFLLFVPLALLSGCGGVTPTLTFNANWYKRTDLNANIEETLERLEYAVSFDPVRSENGFQLSYTDGVYKTELKNDNVRTDGGLKFGYLLTSELNIKVSFSLNGKQSEVFEDRVYTEARFLSAAEGLAPVSSFREVSSHVPYTDLPLALEACYNVYHYTYETTYDDAGTVAKTVYTDLNAPNEAPVERTYEIDGDGTFLDNEQILFALRGLDLAPKTTFRSINSVTGRVQDVVLSNVSDCPEEHLDWSFETQGRQINTAEVGGVSVTIAYSGSNSGLPQVAVYAKKSDPLSNTYRNVLLELNVPVSYSLGTLRYRLSQATFTTK